MDIKTVVTPHHKSNSYIVIINNKCFIIDILQEILY